MQSACLEKGSNVNFSFIVGTFSLYLVAILLDPITKKKKKKKKKRHDFPPTAEFTKVKSLLPILDDFLIWTKQFLFFFFCILPLIFFRSKKVYIRGLDCYNLFLYLVNYDVSISLSLSFLLSHLMLIFRYSIDGISHNITTVLMAYKHMIHESRCY